MILFQLTANIVPVNFLKAEFGKQHERISSIDFMKVNSKPQMWRTAGYIYRNATSEKTKYVALLGS